MTIKTKNGFALFELIIAIAALSIFFGLIFIAQKSRPELKSNEKSVAYEKTYDGCQYIRIIGSSTWVHKGNCNNPVHKYNLEK